MRAFALVVGLGIFPLLFSPVNQAQADACDDIEGKNVSVSATIAWTQRDGDGSWWIKVRDGARISDCPVDGVVIYGRLPDTCSEGRRIEASGEFVIDIFEDVNLVDASSYSC